MRNLRPRILSLPIIPIPQSPKNRITPHLLHPSQSIRTGSIQRNAIRAESLTNHQVSKPANHTKQTKGREQRTQRIGQKKASATENPPNKNPPSSSPNSLSLFLVTSLAASQIPNMRSISATASSGIDTLPVYRARKFVGNVCRNTENPECICDAAVRARARSLRSRGHRASSGWDSARNSQIERLSLIVVFRVFTCRIGTRPVGEWIFICFRGGLFVSLWVVDMGIYLFLLFWWMGVVDMLGNVGLRVRICCWVGLIYFGEFDELVRVWDFEVLQHGFHAGCPAWGSWLVVIHEVLLGCSRSTYWSTGCRDQ